MTKNGEPMNEPARPETAPRARGAHDFPAFPEPTARARGRAPGGLLRTLSIALAALWAVAFTTGAFILVGAERMGRLDFVELLALTACTLLPPLMIWFAHVAAGEGARARHEALRLSDAATKLMAPGDTAVASTRRLADTLRGEITVVDRALDQTLARLADIQGVISGQVQAVNQMAALAKSGAGRMITGLEHERAELLKISQDLTNQTQVIGETISKHTHSVAETSKQVEAELKLADQTLDNRMSSFGAAAALITDRTQGLTTAAQASADSALKLETALSNGIDVLTRAVQLTETARQTTEQCIAAARAAADEAAAAAQSGSEAVHHSSNRAVETAREAAAHIRAEAASIERQAASAVERLREAAESAREAAENARAAAEDSARGGRSLRAAAQQAQQRPPELPERNERGGGRGPSVEGGSHSFAPEWRADAPRPRRGAEPARDEHHDFEEPATRRRARAPEPIDQEDETPDIHFGEEPARGERASEGAAGWTWRDLLSNIDDGAEDPGAAPPRRSRSEDPVARLAQTAGARRSAAVAQAPLEIARMFEQAGLNLEDVFSPSGLDRIAQRSRSGTQSRRRAVRDAAPEAVKRLREHLMRNERASHEAMEFLRAEGARITELLARGRAAMNADATQAFLLIDSAAG